MHTDNPETEKEDVPILTHPRLPVADVTDGIHRDCL